MCRFDTQLFNAEVTETRAARRWLVGVLHRWGLDALRDEVELAGSELVTNALLHTRTGFEVTLAASSGSIELAVRDRDPRQPVLRPPRLDLLADVDTLAPERESAQDPQPARREVARPGAEERHPSLHVGPSGSIAAGRGLLIIDAIADEWGVASHGAGKDVWMRLPLPSDWPYLDQCECDDLAGRTPSGHPVRHVEGHWDGAAELASEATL
jgi:anti-sigma regulatory factor (Ser/Thr protein kinase)